MNSHSDLRIQLIQHKNGDDALYHKVAELKTHHWHYSIEEHLQWMDKNIGPEDYHLLLFGKNTLIAYLNFVNCNVTLSDRRYPFLGVGNVCVHKEYLKMNLGKFLMDIANLQMTSLSKPGLLFCKEALIPFYTRCGWVLYKGEGMFKGEVIHSNIFFNDSIFVGEPRFVIDAIF